MTILGYDVDCASGDDWRVSDASPADLKRPPNFSVLCIQPNHLSFRGPHKYDVPCHTDRRSNFLPHIGGP